ncbi:MAG: ATP-binding cassette domain-containing protein [Solirubrobacterales bacterium]|nr:ATP-binding cassette domain-containing protein [Solirubrobacterales bacterium]
MINQAILTTEPRPSEPPANASGEPGSPPTEAVIAVRDLHKSYGQTEAVRGVDLEVGRGEIFAFLGPNGAGKTTTVEIMEGFREADSGTVEVLGEDPARPSRRWRERIGIVLQESPGETELSVRECLELYAGLYPAPRPIDETLELVGIGELGQKPSGRLSGGERRRLDVALALIGDPELIFLDEPTTGFDPAARRAAWEMLSGLRSLGKTIFLTTHYMEEAERLADRIAVIAGGRIVDAGTPRTLGRRDLAASRISFSLPTGVDPGELPPELLGLADRIDGRRVTLLSPATLAAVQRLGTWADGRDLEIGDLEVARPSLEDTYLTLTDDQDDPDHPKGDR